MGNILNDDTTEVSIQNLGLSGNLLEFVVRSSQTVHGGFELDYSTADDTAIAANGDYTPTSGTLMFLGTAGEERFFSVDVNPGLTPKSFRLNLGPRRALGNGVDANDLFVVTPSLFVPIPVLEDEDGISTLTLASVAATRSEGTGSGTTAFTFSVTLDKAISGGFTLAYTTTDGTATLADGDYMNNDGNLIFAGTAGEVQTITVLVNHDSKVEADEVFSVFLGVISMLPPGFDPSRLVVAGSPQMGNILNDDTTEVSIQNLGLSGNLLEFVVRSSQTVHGGFELDYSTADDTAIAANGDYTPTSGTLMFLGTAGEERFFSVDVNPGLTPKSFRLNLGPRRALGNGVDANDLFVVTPSLLSQFRRKSQSRRSLSRRRDLEVDRTSECSGRPTISNSSVFTPTNRGSRAGCGWRPAMSTAMVSLTSLQGPERAAGLTLGFLMGRTERNFIAFMPSTPTSMAESIWRRRTSIGMAGRKLSFRPIPAAART